MKRSTAACQYASSDLLAGQPSGLCDATGAPFGRKRIPERFQSLWSMGRSSRTKRTRRDQAATAAALSKKLLAEALTRGCLFCRELDGGFTSQEHILPEAMGNRDKVLPPGVVCDRCNHGRLSVIDEALSEFHPVKLWRTLHGVRTKSGSFPTVVLANGSITYLPSPSPGAEPILSVKSNSPRRPVFARSELEDGRVSVEGVLRGGRPLTSRHASELSRALFKIGLELLWLDNPTVAFSPDLDHIRAATLGAPRDGFFAVIEGTSDLTPLHSRVTYQPHRTSVNRIDMVVLLQYKGVVAFTDTQHATLPNIPDGVHAKAVSFTAS